MRVLVTGATGYIGGRLVPLLLERGWEVRCLARTPSKLRDVPWRDDVEVVEGDVLDEGTLGRAFEGVDVGYYLVHSIGSGTRFAERDRAGAVNFGAVARRAGTRRLVYLGGLTPEGGAGALSPHLRSRAEVAEILHRSGVPTVTLRAAVILGSGSAGRRDPNRLRVGESLDFWRVEELEPGRLLRLRAEMKLPGLAWLELGVDRGGGDRPVLVQRAVFHPRGLAGQAHWWGIRPFHGVVFGGMLRNIALAAEREVTAPAGP